MIARSLVSTVIVAATCAGSAWAQSNVAAPDLFLAAAVEPQAPQLAPAPSSQAPTAPRAPRVPTPAPPQGESPQPPPPPAAPPAAPTSPKPRPENQSTNVRVDVTITDERTGSAPIKKTVSIVTGDGLNGSVRSQTNFSGPNNGVAPFNVDALPVMMGDGKVHTRLTVQYDAPMANAPAPNTQGGAPAPILSPFANFAGVRDSVAVILENGKPLVVVQSTDPVSDRKVSVEVKATILR